MTPPAAWVARFIADRTGLRYLIDFGGNRLCQSTLGGREASLFAGRAVLPPFRAFRWRTKMNRAVLSLMAASALPLAACTTPADNDTLASAGTGAAIGAAGGAGVAAIAGGDLLTGAAIGAAVGGLAGAVWADRNNDGQADGYVYNGQYYEGAPSGTHNALSDRTPPNAPIGFTAVFGPSGVLINWSGPVTGQVPDHYIVYRNGVSIRQVTAPQQVSDHPPRGRAAVLVAAVQAVPVARAAAVDRQAAVASIAPTSPARIILPVVIAPPRLAALRRAPVTRTS